MSEELTHSAKTGIGLLIFVLGVLIALAGFIYAYYHAGKVRV